VEKTFNLQTLAHLRSMDTAAEDSPNPYNRRRAMFFLLGPPIQKDFGVLHWSNKKMI
jgi:hypothetical protein